MVAPNGIVELTVVDAGVGLSVPAWMGWIGIQLIVQASPIASIDRCVILVFYFCYSTGLSLEVMGVPKAVKAFSTCCAIGFFL